MVRVNCQNGDGGGSWVGDIEFRGPLKAKVESVSVCLKHVRVESMPFQHSYTMTFEMREPLKLRVRAANASVLVFACQPS